MATAPIVSIERLVKRYDDRVVVDGVSAEVRPGEVLGLLGPNGAGKTTVIKCLLGLVRPDAGTIRIGGVPLDEAGARTRALLGYVPQKTDLGDGLTGSELLRLVCRLRLLGPRDLDRAVERAGAAGLLQAPLDTLSGGQMQRVLLAQALLGDPPLLVFDEPTVSLDPLAQHEYIELVQSMRDEGHAILLSSHLLGEVEQLADCALVLVAGRAVARWHRDEWSEVGLERRFLEAVGPAHRSTEARTGSNKESDRRALTLVGGGGGVGS